MEKEIHWSLVLKIIKPEQGEKNNAQHHNYWKREALVNQSGLLTNLSDVIYTPQCYKVEKQENGLIWIWMEEIQEDNTKPWSENEFAFAARKLGMFNGGYLLDKTTPDYTWICRQWLKSWVYGCKKYSIDPSTYYSKVQNLNNINSIYNSYHYLNENLDKHFNALASLPRVLAHQDLSKQNMYTKLHKGTKKLTLIDWQFLSISGLGEDLGKLYGVALSQQDIPIEKGDYYQDLLFTNYIEGLRDAGWNKDSTLARYGFCISFALRSAWEVPKLIKQTADSIMMSDKEKMQSIEILTRITSIQMELGKEAEKIRPVNI
ncbi:oxidoreductase family protein [Ornithinibacillus salinisoli]|uniref:oxidoreductase family protein n=1 Tax=Ornithinibacillus salinisoli TaxID=1848459 RepID=UPI003670D1DA